MTPSARLPTAPVQEAWDAIGGRSLADMIHIDHCDISGVIHVGCEDARRRTPSIPADLGSRQGTRKSTSDWLSPLMSKSTSAILDRLGSAGRMKTPIDCYANISPVGTDLPLHSQAKFSAIARASEPTAKSGPRPHRRRWSDMGPVPDCPLLGQGGWKAEMHPSCAGTLPQP